jgi:hypothetical protein
MAKPVVTDPVNGKLTIFNGDRSKGRDRVLVYVFPDLGPTFVSVGTVVRRGGGYTLDFTIPPIKTLPNAPDASVTLFDVTTRDLTVRRRGRTIHYIDSPVLCDGTFFMLDGQFTYQGNTKVDVLERFTLRGGPRCP